VVALVVVTSNRGLAGAYNGSVLRQANAFIREREAAGDTVELQVVGKKGINYFNYQRRPMAVKSEAKDVPSFDAVNRAIQPLINRFVDGEIDAVHVAYMNFVSTGLQRPEVVTILPLAGLKESLERIGLQVAEKEAQAKAGALDAARRAENVRAAETQPQGEVIYDFSPSVKELLDELLPLTVKTAFFQTFLDATTSEHVARMVAMKSATDNADKMVKALTMQYNRARQSQITTELSEIMGGVEAMKG
jgi:F-type H+-transporting ATPase subunit gamma